MMNKEDIAFRKLALLFESKKQLDAITELENCAFEVLRLHHGCDKDKLISILIEQYSTEVSDAYGNINDDVLLAKLEKLWSTSYYDEYSGLEYKISKWAEVFATEASVQMYYDLINK